MLQHSITAPEQTQLTLLHSERSKLYTILAFLSAIGLMVNEGLKWKLYTILAFLSAVGLI